MRVLVTGAAGYVGRAVVARLAADGHEVVALVRGAPDAPPGAARAVRADLLDPMGVGQAVRAARPEGVCHLAALTRVQDSFADPLGYFAVNVRGTLHLLEALRGATRRGAPPPALVFASTAAVYGRAAVQPIPEDAPPSPASPYASSKWAGEELVRWEAGTGCLGAVSLRCFNAAGGRDPDPTRLLPRALAVAAGREPRLAVNGDGSAVREYVHVADLAASYALALGAARPGAHRAYNVAAVAASVSEVVGAVEQVTGRPVPIEWGPPRDEPQELRADGTRIRSELGWRPERADLRAIVEDGWRIVRGPP